MSLSRGRNSNNRLLQMRTFTVLTLACYFLLLVDSKSLPEDQSLSIVTKHQEKLPSSNKLIEFLEDLKTDENELLPQPLLNVFSRSKRSRSPPIWLMKCPNSEGSCIPGSLYCPCSGTSRNDDSSDNFFSKLFRKLGL